MKRINTFDLERREENKMTEMLLGQYFNQGLYMDEMAWPNFLEHPRYTGKGASDYNKKCADILVEMLSKHGAQNLTAQFLPVDQFLEHWGGNYLGKGYNRDYADPRTVLNLAQSHDLNGIVFHPGWAEIHQAVASTVPLILKVSGATSAGAKSSGGRHQSHLLYPSVADMVAAATKYNAQALGYTWYMGSPSEAFIMRDFNMVRKAAEEAGLPLIVWAYPRGGEIDKIGRDSFPAVLGAVTSALAMGGVHILKINLPKRLDSTQETALLEGYKDTHGMLLEWMKEKGREDADFMREIVRVALDSGVGIIVSGGKKSDSFGIVDKVASVMKTGALGVINGRAISTTMDDNTGTEKENLLTQDEIIEATRFVLRGFPRVRPV